MTIYVILFFVALLIGMVLSVYAFGTGGKRQHIFQDIYFSVEDTNGIGVIYTKTGEYSAVLKLDNPVQKYHGDPFSHQKQPLSLPRCCFPLMRLPLPSSPLSLSHSSRSLQVLSY